jgi:two-component system response regulator NreC
MTPIRLFLVDDHTLFLAGLRSLLRDQPDLEVSGDAATGAEALRRLKQHQPDVVLLDLTLPDGSGIQWLQKILQQSPEQKVIILTMHDDLALAKAALAHGAMRFVVKTAADSELITAIRAVSKGRTFVNLRLAPEDMGKLLTNSVEKKQTQDPLHHLSKREREVFLLLAQGHTNQVIADRFDLSVKTVETYRARIFEKYGLRSRADLIRFAIETGALQAGTGDSPQ